MSITISIRGNYEYIDANHPHLIVPPDARCQCLIGQNDQYVPDATCPGCSGSGIDALVADDPGTYPYELNISNTNFKLLWNCLGFECTGNTDNYLDITVIEDGCSGEMDAQEFYNALDSLRPELMVRPVRSFARSFEFGVDEERVQYYITTLKNIAMEAIHRDESIVWG